MKKIDIYRKRIDGKYDYFFSTTQSKTCKDAIASIRAQYPNAKLYPDSLKANFAKK